MTAKRKIVRERLFDAASAKKIDAGRGMPHALSRNVSDSLYNLTTGLGTSKDKSYGTMFGFNSMDKAQLEAAYRSDWISRKVIDIPAYDATREWRTWQSETSDTSKIETVENSLNVRQKLKMALTRSRLYGGGGLVMGVDQGNSADPLDVAKLGKDCLKWVHAVSRYEITAGPTDWDLNSPWFGTPAYYERSIQAVSATANPDVNVMRQQAKQNATLSTNGGIVRIHPSRFVRFVGMEYPEWSTGDGWGDSVLQIVADAVLAMGTVAQSIASLVQEAKLDIIKIPEMSERIADKKYEARLNARFATSNILKSMFSLLILDKEEDWQRVQQQFTGMPEVLQEYMLMVCGGADIPATRFLGQSPKGMNATGDSDTRNYYDKVSTEQEITVTPAMQTLDDVIVISALGSKPDGLFYEWNPLWQMDEAQKADIAVKQSQVMTADVNAGLMDPMVLQKAREAQLIESGFYPGIEQIIEEYGTDIDEREPNANDIPTHIDPETGLPADPSNPKAVPNPAHPNPFAGSTPTPGNAANSNDPNADDPKKKTGNAGAISDMQRRIRDAITDASTPRTLYIYRPVLNWQDIKKHYADQGVANVIGEEQHVTICYSRTPVDWLKVGNDNWSSQDDEGRLVIKAGGPRVMEKFGNFLVLAFSNSDLQWRHCSILERTGGSWDYDDYTPHVSISKDPGGVNIADVQPYTGPIVLGPEEFEEIKQEYFAKPGDPDLTAQLGDNLRMIVDAIRNMPPPQVTVTVEGGRKVVKETIFKQDQSGRIIAATTTETTEG